VPLSATTSGRVRAKKTELALEEAWHEDDRSWHAARHQLLLADLRLHAIKLMWPSSSEQSDKEGDPTARVLAALAEHEIADRRSPPHSSVTLPKHACPREDARQLRVHGGDDGQQGGR